MTTDATADLYVRLMAEPYPLAPEEYADLARTCRYSAEQLRALHGRADADAGAVASAMLEAIAEHPAVGLSVRRSPAPYPYPALRRAIRYALADGMR